MYSKIASRPGSRFCLKASIDGSAKRLGEIHVRRSLAVELCQYKLEQLSRRPLHGSCTRLVSPTKFGLEPVGSPAKITFELLDVDGTIHRRRKRTPACEHKEMARAIDLVIPDQPVN